MLAKHYWEAVAGSGDILGKMCLVVGLGNILTLYVLMCFSDIALSSVRIQGNITLGGLFPVHLKGAENCGVFDANGFQRMEAMIYALQQINNDDNLLPGVTIGATLLDSCKHDTHALDQAMSFVTSTRIDGDITCSDGKPPEGYEPRQPTIGVVGAASSPVSAMVANILRLFKVTKSAVKVDLLHL